jgi:ABC-type amino acid transport substrate-binding protein
MRCLAAFILMIMASVPAAQAAPKIVALAIPGVFEADKSGDYDKVLAKVAANGVTVDYSVIAPGRAEADFKERKFACTMPIDVRFWPGKEKLVNSEPMNVVKIFLFSRTGEGPYTSLDQLKGKLIGARRGIPYGPKLAASGMTPELVNEDDQNVQKLQAKRIDAFLAYVPDMWFWAKDKKQPLPNHDKDHPVDIHRDALLCHDTPENRAYIKAFDAEVVKLRASGELQKILGPSFVQ